MSDVGLSPSLSGFNTPFCLTFRHNVTVCIGETLAQLPDRAQRLSNWAAAATTNTAAATATAAGTATKTEVASAGAAVGTAVVANKMKNNTGNGTSSGGSSSGSGGKNSVGVVFSLSHLRELPHVLVVNEWGLHHHRYLTNSPSDL